MPRRLFIAIDLPKPACWRLGQLLLQPPRGVRPVRTVQLHLTLHFLGDVEDTACVGLPEALAEVTHDAFSIAIRGTGMFPPRGRPSVLWAGVAESAALAELHAAIGAALVSHGLAIDDIPVDRFHLYRSRKLDGATEHSVEATFPLGIRPSDPPATTA
jgi:2'-5' RNA ligase